MTPVLPGPIPQSTTLVFGPAAATTPVEVE
jgi:hypothetical protein